MQKVIDLSQEVLLLIPNDKGNINLEESGTPTQIRMTQSVTKEHLLSHKVCTILCHGF